MTQATGNNFWSNLTSTFENIGRSIGYDAGGGQPVPRPVDYTPIIVTGLVVAIVVYVLVKK